MSFNQNKMGKLQINTQNIYKKKPLVAYSNIKCHFNVLQDELYVIRTKTHPLWKNSFLMLPRLQPTILVLLVSLHFVLQPKNPCISSILCAFYSFLMLLVYGSFVTMALVFTSSMFLSCHFWCFLFLCIYKYKPCMKF